MCRAIIVILMLCLLGNPSTFAVPHSHEGSSIVEPEGHDDHPHFHWYGDESHSGPGEQDHDSSAVYTGDEQLFRDGSGLEITVTESSLCSILVMPWANGIPSANQSENLISVSRFCCGCKIYLQYLSIRC